MEDWSFQESYIWSNNYPKCAADKQSPINIDTELVQECKTMCSFDTQYKNTSCFIKNTNNLISISVSPGSYFIYDNTPFELSEITIHVPSIHTLDGSKAEVEICLVHKLSNTANSTLNGIVLSRMFDKGPEYGSAETFINQIINNIPAENVKFEQQIEVSPSWGGNMIIPKKNKSYFTYDGSLHYPPCTENIKWFIYEDIGTIGITNIETLKNYIGNNARPIQRLGNRTVFYVVENEETKSNDRKIFLSDNKYLKCIKTNETSTRTYPISTSPIELENSEGIDPELLKKIKRYILIIIILLIFVQAYFVLKYAYKHFYFQNFLQLIAGNLVINQGVIERWKRPDCESSTTASGRKYK
jgi:carbonic anhydrase